MVICDICQRGPAATITVKLVRKDGTLMGGSQTRDLCRACAGILARHVDSFFLASQPAQTGAPE